MSDEQHRLDQALSGSTHAAVLATLAVDVSDAVRLAVAGNPATPEGALHRLIDDSDPAVREKAATHPELSDQLIAKLEHTPDEAIARGLARRGKDMSGRDLTGKDFSHADLTGADLTGTDLTGADLNEADLAGADLEDDDGRPGGVVPRDGVGRRSLRRVLDLAIEGEDEVAARRRRLDLRPARRLRQHHARAGVQQHRQAAAGDPDLRHAPDGP